MNSCLSVNDTCHGILRQSELNCMYRTLASYVAGGAGGAAEPSGPAVPGQQLRERHPAGRPGAPRGPRRANGLRRHSSPPPTPRHPHARAPAHLRCLAPPASCTYAAPNITPLIPTLFCTVAAVQHRQKETLSVEGRLSNLQLSTFVKRRSRSLPHIQPAAEYFRQQGAAHAPSHLRSFAVPPWPGCSDPAPAMQPQCCASPGGG